MNRSLVDTKQQYLLANEKAKRLRRLEPQCARYSQIDSSTGKGRVSRREDDGNVVEVAMVPSLNLILNRV